MKLVPAPDPLTGKPMNLVQGHPSGKNVDLLNVHYNIDVFTEGAQLPVARVEHAMGKVRLCEVTWTDPDVRQTPKVSGDPRGVLKSAVVCGCCTGEAEYVAIDGVPVGGLGGDPRGVCADGGLPP